MLYGRDVYGPCGKAALDGLYWLCQNVDVFPSRALEASLPVWKLSADTVEPVWASTTPLKMRLPIQSEWLIQESGENTLG